MRAEVSTGRSSMPMGKSHSCDLPTNSERAPSAQTISVAEGRSEAMRIAVTIADSKSGKVERPRRLVDQVGCPIEVCANAKRPVDGRAAPAEGAQKIKPVSAVLEEAMDVYASHVSLAIAEPAGQVHLDVGIGDRSAEMDLVAIQPAAVARKHARPSRGLQGGKRRVDVELSQALGVRT